MFSCMVCSGRVATTVPESPIETKAVGLDEASWLVARVARGLTAKVRLTGCIAARGIGQLPPFADCVIGTNPAQATHGTNSAAKAKQQPFWLVFCPVTRCCIAVIGYCTTTRTANGNPPLLVVL